MDLPDDSLIFSFSPSDDVCKICFEANRGRCYGLCQDAFMYDKNLPLDVRTARLFLRYNLNGKHPSGLPIILRPPQEVLDAFRTA